MATTLSYKPGEYMAAYADVPVEVKTTFDFDNHYALLNALYDENEFDTFPIPYSIGSQLFTQVTLINPNKYEVGDVLYILDSGNVYFGYTRVIEIISANEIVLDFTLTLAPSSNIKLFKVSQFKSPLYQSGTTFNLTEDFSNLVKSSYQKEYEYYDASSTRKDIKLSLTEEYNYELRFTDNGFTSGGFLGFINPAITSLTNIPFNVGDFITVEQDLLQWNTTSFNSDNGNLRFVGPPHNFLVGQELIMTYLTPANLNRSYVVTSIVDTGATQSVTVDFPYSGGTVGNGGAAFGLVRPNYNGIAQIIDLYIDPNPFVGLVIKTNKPFGPSSQAIGGVIRFANGRNLKAWNIDSNDLTIYQANLESKYDYTNNNMIDYVVSAAATGKKISTILEPNEVHYVNKDDVNHLLMHFSSSTLNLSAPNLVGVKIDYFNESGALLGETATVTTGRTDFYFPSSINDQINNNLKVDVTGVFSSYTQDIRSYDVYCIGLQFGQQVTEKIKFKLPDCSRYEKISIAWRDKKGSLISYPFNLLSRDFIESEKKEYYGQTGKFEDGQWEHGLRRGNTIYNNRSKEKLILNSDWVEEYENKKIKDMFNSSEVFVIKGGEIFPCTITNKEMEDKKVINDLIYNYTFEVYYAFDNVNR